MEMIKVKTSELTGAALDWAVGISTGLKFDHAECFPEYWVDGKMHPTIEPGRQSIAPYSPSTDWARCGIFIGTLVHWIEEQGPDYWGARCGGEYGYASTPMVAICRAVVTGKLGEEIEVPVELVKAAS